MNASLHIRLSRWKIVLFGLFLLLIAYFAARNGLADLASPEAFAEALERAEHRRRTQPIEVFSNRYAYGLFVFVTTLAMAGLSLFGLWMSTTARGLALILDGERIERVTPWSRTEYSVSTSSILTPVSKGLEVQPPARIVAAVGKRAGTVGKEVSLIPMPWAVADMSAKKVRRWLELNR